MDGFVCEVKHQGAFKTKRYHECMETLSQKGVKQISIEEAIQTLFYRKGLTLNKVR